MDLVRLLEIVIISEIALTVIVATAVAISDRITVRAVRRGKAGSELILGQDIIPFPKDDLVHAVRHIRQSAEWVRGEEQSRIAARLRVVAQSGRLVELLNDRRGWVRAEGAHLMSFAPAAEGVDRLAELISDPDYEVRVAAARSLGQMVRLPDVDPARSKEALHALAASLDDPESFSTIHVQSILTAIGSPAVDAITEIIAGLTERGRAAGAAVLGEISDVRAVPVLMALVKDADLNVRARAIAALGRIGDPRAYEPLLSALRDEAWEVRGQAVNALGQLGDPAAAAALRASLTDPSWWVRLRASRSLFKLGPGGIDQLRDALTDDDAYARERAAIELESNGVVGEWITSLHIDLDARQALEDAVAAGAMTEVIDVLRSGNAPEGLLETWERGFARLRELGRDSEQWAERVLELRSIYR